MRTAIQVRLSGRLYTYAVDFSPGDGEEPPRAGDTAVLPRPGWAPETWGDQLAEIERVGDECEDTGYRGALTLARFVPRARSAE